LITDELHENWIAKEFVDSLGLTPKENAKGRIGKSSGQTFRFGGTVLISWSWKDAALSGQTKQTICHVVPLAKFQIMLKPSQFDPALPKTSPLTPPQNFNRQLPISPEIPRLDSGTISTPATILSDGQTEGFIDDFEDYGEFCDDASDECVYSHFRFIVAVHIVKLHTVANVSQRKSSRKLDAISSIERAP